MNNIGYISLQGIFLLSDFEQLHAVLNLCLSQCGRHSHLWNYYFNYQLSF